jgi:hypothetical protein
MIMRTRGVSIAVTAEVSGAETALLWFNCFDIEKSYIYGPEDPSLAGNRSGGMGQLCRMDPTTDGNPIGWTMKALETKLPKMLERAGYQQLAQATDLAAVRRVLPDVDACARDLSASRRNTVKHNRGTDIFEAGNIRFGLEMRRQMSGDGRLAIHVLGDVGGSRRKSYMDETELLAFDFSGMPRTTTMVHAIRIIAFSGTRRWLRNRWSGSLSSSKTVRSEP